MFHLKRDACKNIRGLLSAYIDHQLGSADVQKVEEHVATCDSCRKEFEGLKATIKGLQCLPRATARRSFLIPETAAPEPFPAPFPTFRAGTAMIAVFLALVFIGDIFNLFAPQSPAQALPVSPQPSIERSVVASPSPTLQKPPDTVNQGFIQDLLKEAAGLWWLRPFEVGLLIALLLLGTGGVVGWWKTGKGMGGFPDS